MSTTIFENFTKTEVNSQKLANAPKYSQILTFDFSQNPEEIQQCRNSWV